MTEKSEEDDAPRFLRRADAAKYIRERWGIHAHRERWPRSRAYRVMVPRCTTPGEYRSTRPNRSMHGQR